jgi:T5SS/PEP-CTERM-associated repeat protein
MNALFHIRRRRTTAACVFPLLAIAASMIAAPSAHAVVLTWDKFGNGNYNDANNWFGGGPPTANDWVKFELGWGPYTVYFPGNQLVVGGSTPSKGFGPANYYAKQLRIRDQALTFSGSTSGVRTSSNYNVTSTSQGEFDRGIIIGESIGENAQLTLAHSSLTGGALANLNSVAATLGQDEGATGTLNVNVGSFNVTGSEYNVATLMVGNNGTGKINVNNGAKVNVNGFNSRTSIGRNATGAGDVTVNGPGSTWSSANELWIGEKGFGQLKVQNGGTLVTDGSGGTDSTIIGVFNGGRGSVTVAGAGSTWNTGSRIVVGNTGNGEIYVRDGGKITSANGANVEIGSGSFGVATVTGVGSEWTTPGTMYVGSTGQGALQIRDGGKVTAGGMLVRGLNSGYGEVFLSGAGSTLDVTTGSLTVGMPESGFTTARTVLSINSGAAVNVAHDIDLDTNGVVRLNGGTLTVGEIHSQDLLTGQIEGAFEWTAGTLKTSHFGGSLTNQAGRLSPGVPVSGFDFSTTVIDGNYTQLAAGTMAMDIGGLTAGASHDFVYLEGSANLAGMLELSLTNGFTPTAQQKFTILNSLNPVSGAFANVANGARLATIDGLGSFQVNYGMSSLFDPTQIVLSGFEATPADLGSSFLAWQRGFDPTNPVGFGGGGGAPQAPSIAGVPEPTSFALAGVVALGLAAVTRRKKLG